MRFLSDVISTQDLAYALCKGLFIPFHVLFVIFVNRVWTFYDILYQLQKEGHGRP